MATFFILLPVHNRCETTLKFVQCLKRQSQDNYHLVLIDDGSSDGTSEMVRQNIESLTILKGDGNLWWAGALQKGYKWLKQQFSKQKIQSDDIVLIINDDVEFSSDFLKLAEMLLPIEGGYLLLAHCYSQQSGKLLDSGVHVDWNSLTFSQAESLQEINCFSTRGLFLRGHDFLKIGGFRPWLLPHYASDYEFTIRAFNQGLKPLTNPELTVMLDESKPGFSGFLSDPMIPPRRRFFLNFQKFFSMKTPINPLTWSVFVTLACPLRRTPVNLLRVWINASKHIKSGFSL